MRFHRYLAWLFFSYALIEVLDFGNLLGLMVSNPTETALSYGMNMNAFYAHTWARLLYILFLIVNAALIARHITKKPHFAKIPVGVTYSVIVVVGYAWYWMLQSIFFPGDSATLAFAMLHLAFALGMGVIAEKLPEEQLRSVIRAHAAAHGKKRRKK